MIKGIIFDFDGTLVDSETQIFKAWSETYSHFGQVLPFDLWVSIVGTNDGKFHPGDYLHSKLKQKNSLEEIMKFETALENELILQITTIPGVREYLATARQMGIKMGIASSASSEWVHDTMGRLGIASYFEAITTQEEVQLTKPYPYLFEKTLKKMDLYPYQVIAIEDSPFGITAAQAAGIFAVAVPNDITRSMSLDHADMVIQSLAEVTLPDLINRITAS